MDSGFPWPERGVTARDHRGPINSRCTPTSEQYPDSTENLGSAEVSHAFEDLISRYQKLLQQPTSDASNNEAQTPNPTNLPGISRQIIEDAQKEADSIKMRARQDADVEAGRIVTDAKRDAQETLSRAQRDAQAATEREVESILRSAQKRAQINEERAKQVAQLFLVRAREDIQTYMTGDAKEAYYKLLSSLQDMMSAAQDVENEWKRKTTALWDSTAFQMDELSFEEFHSALVGSFAAGTLEAPPEEEALESTRLSEQEPIADAEREAALVADFAAEVEDSIEVPLVSTTPEVQGTTADPVAGATNEVEEESGTEDSEAAAITAMDEEVSPDGLMAPDSADEEEEVGVEGLIEAVATDTEEQTFSKDTISQASLEVEVDEETPGEDQSESKIGDVELGPATEDQNADMTGQRDGLLVTSAGDDAQTRTETQPPVTSEPTLYMSVVELEIVPFADMAGIVEFHALLGGVDGVRIESTAGSWDRGTTITVALERPMLLRELLSQLPNVEATPAGPPREGILKTTFDQLAKRSGTTERIDISFASKPDNPTEVSGDSAPNEE